jgi:hypothetical protein
MKKYENCGINLAKVAEVCTLANRSFGAAR